MTSQLRSLEAVIQEFSRLPGIGRKSAQRVAFHLLKAPEENVQALIRALSNLKSNIRTCTVCFNISEGELCPICANPQRDAATLCVVEESHDITAIENTGTYRGLYHVLGGVIAPLDGVGPNQLNIRQLQERISRGDIREIIFALNPTTEGDATIHYLIKTLKSMGVKFSRLARGIPAGGDLEFIDQVTVSRALEGREEL